MNNGVNNCDEAVPKSINHKHDWVFHIFYAGVSHLLIFFLSSRLPLVSTYLLSPFIFFPPLVSCLVSFSRLFPFTFL